MKNTRVKRLWYFCFYIDFLFLVSVLVKNFVQLFLWSVAGQAVNHLPVLLDQEGWDGHDAKVLGRFRVVVNVHLSEVHVLSFFGQSFDDW